MKLIAGLFVSLISLSTLAESNLKLISQGLNEKEKERAQELLVEIDHLLPEKIHAALKNRPVKILFKEMKTNKRWGEYIELLSVIRLNKNLLASDEALSQILEDLRKQNILSKHTDLNEFRLASIVHEIGHHYDEMNVDYKEFSKEFPACPKIHSQKVNQVQPLICHIKDNVTTSVSTRPWFLEAAGFSYNGFLINTRISPKGPNARATDVYERTSPKEFFTVNLEYFLLNKEFRCRKPFLYDVYAKHFNHQPFSESSCEADNRVYIYDLLGIDNKDAIFGLDPERIYDLHYLFAGEGKKAMSRFGHAMLRLVVCKPGRAKGPECLQDIAYHKVISFRALIGDENISTWKGLTGGYFSSMPVYSLTQIIQEYTELELRNMYSYPLNLSEEKIELATKLISERFWSYAGDYKFLSNNCADETTNFLKALLYDVPESWDLLINRPDHLAKFFERKNLLSMEPLADKAKAEKEGLFFKTKQVMYENHLKILKNLNFLNQQITLDQYFELKTNDREEIINKITAPDSNSIPAVASALQFERIIFLKKRFELENKVKQALAKELESKKAKINSEEQVIEVVQNSMNSKILPPGMLLEKDDAAYGVPLTHEIEKFQELFKAQPQKSAEEMKAREEKNKEQSNLLFPTELKELEKMNSLSKSLINKYKELKNIKK